MANETILSALNSDAAEAVVAQFLLLLADRNWLGNLPTLHFAGSCNGMFSNVVSVPAYGLMGYDSAASTAEASGASNTVLTDAKYQITVGKYTHILQPSDIAKMILGATRVLDPATLALNAAAIGAAKLSDLLCDVVDGFTATAGPGSGIDADIPSLLAAVGKMGTLNVDKSRGFTGLLHGQQWSDIMVDSATTGGAIQFTFQNEAAGLLQLSPGAKGRWAGIDWFESNRVVSANAGADRAGGIWGYGAVGWADGQYVAEDENQLSLGHTLFERQRVAASGLTSYVTHTMLGVSKMLEAGVTYISDL